MENKMLLSVAVIFISFLYAHALRCYTCNSKDPDRHCASPMDTSKVISEECGKSTSYSNTPFDSADDKVLRAAGNSSEYQCVAYEKFYFAGNATHALRGCMQKYDDFCKILNQTAQHEKTYNLTRCHICHTEHCNSSTNLHISALLCLFGLILGGTVKNLI